ncbi:MAG: hypothetical protein MUO26_04990 [Methanotrichaceae archaeon]|nr:hypothetical protein [Methanotrichaceae archaeon]
MFLVIKSLKALKAQIDNRTPLFYTDFLNLWEKNDVYRMFLYYKKKAGLKNKVVFMSLADIRRQRSWYRKVVKEVQRHRDIRTTLRYVHVADNIKRELYNRCLTLFNQ